MTVSTYQNAFEIIFKNPWPSSIYGAQLVTSDYAYDVSHSTRADIFGSTVGSPITLSGKSVSGGIVTCNSLDFSSQGDLTGAYIVVHLMSSGSPLESDSLVFHCDFNSGINLLITSSISIDLGNIVGFTEV